MAPTRWKALRRAGVDVGRDRVARLMRSLGLHGVHRGKKRRTTTPGPEGERPSDLVERQFVAAEPNRPWVTDPTYVAIFSGFSYVAFVIDVFSRTVVGWQVATNLRAELALDALES